MNGMMTAQHRDLHEISEILAQAFMQEEFWCWAIQAQHLTADVQKKKLKQLFKIQSEKYSLPFNSAYLLDNKQGAALWTPPNQWQLNLLQEVLLLPHFIKIVGLKQLFSVLKVIHQIQAYHPTTPHYYLQVIGVLPQAQGKGYSSQLLKPVLDLCDQQGHAAYLETATPNNISLYRHFGFEILNILDDLPNGAPVLYTMWREPQRVLF